MKFGSRACTIVQGVFSNFGATLKIQILIGISSNFLHNKKAYLHVHVSGKSIIKIKNLGIVINSIMPVIFMYMYMNLPFSSTLQRQGWD